MVNAPNDYLLFAGIDDARAALIDDHANNWLNYGELKLKCGEWAARLSGERGVVFLFAHNVIETVCALFGSLAAGHCVALFDPALSDERRNALVSIYEPEWIVDTGSNMVPQSSVMARKLDEAVPHPDLSILLSTSGSTGSPKLVKLTSGNILSNAWSIGEVLEIGQNDVAAGHLPLHYSFGLSVLTSHLVRGARVRLTAKGFMDRQFWPSMRDAAISHLPGVPFHFQIMQKLGYQRLNVPTVRSMAQAGGFLDVPSREVAHAFMESAGGRFYVMYGQTEASPRMTTLAHCDFAKAPASVGVALPGCRIKILTPDANGQGEVEFNGPNVMLGYAETRADLSRGDESGGRLLTGDIGFLDSDGRLTLTGRAKRFGKIYGLRINLDEVERFAMSVVETAVVQDGDDLQLFVVQSGDAQTDGVLRQRLLSGLREQYTLPPASYVVKPVLALPRTERGKIDYLALKDAS